MSVLKQKILVTRTDRLGDVLLSLPAIALLRKHLPDAEIHFLCKDEYGELLAPYLRTIYVKAIEHEYTELGVLAEVLRSERYRAGLFLHAESSLALAAMIARVSKRVGAYSKPWSFLLYNRGRRQRRSRVTKNEAEYNLDLAAYMIERVFHTPVTDAIEPITLPRQSHAEVSAHRVLRELDLTADHFLIVHPGMGGSARNLSPAAYAAWIPELERLYGIPALLSEGPAPQDAEMIREIQAVLPGRKVVRGQKLPVFMELLRSAALVVAPSTGPLHLAHYVGTRTLGIYSPNSTEISTRWAPFGGSGLSTVLDCTAEGRFLSLGAWREQLAVPTMA